MGRIYTVVDEAVSGTSNNPVSNKAIKKYVDDKIPSGGDTPPSFTGNLILNTSLSYGEDMSIVRETDSEITHLFDFSDKAEFNLNNKYFVQGYLSIILNNLSIEYITRQLKGRDSLIISLYKNISNNSSYNVLKHLDVMGGGYRSNNSYVWTPIPFSGFVGSPKVTVSSTPKLEYINSVGASILPDISYYHSLTINAQFYEVIGEE